MCAVTLNASSTTEGHMRTSFLRALFPQGAVHSCIIPPQSISCTRPTFRSLISTSRMMQINGSIDTQSRLGQPDLELSETDDDIAVRSKYRPFLLDERVAKSDWISKLELETVERMVQTDLDANKAERLRVLVLYGSLRARYLSISSSSMRSMPANRRQFILTIIGF